MTSAASPSTPSPAGFADLVVAYRAVLAWALLGLGLISGGVGV